MSLTFADNRWQWRGTARNRYLPKAAGFRWSPENKVWWTQDHTQAAELVDYADQAAKDAIAQARSGAAPVEADPVPRPTLTMVRTLVDATYVWRGVFETRELPKAAGFSWNRDEKYWETSSAMTASKLIEYADEPTAEALRQVADHREASLSGSHAAVPSDGFSVPAPKGLEYMPFQLAGIEYALKRTGTLIGDEMGLGKAQAIDSPVLTPHGWRLMGDIQVGDCVIGGDGKPKGVVGVYPQGVKALYRITFSDGATAECCEDHLWQVTTSDQKRRGASAQVLSLRQLMRLGLHDGRGYRKWEIPLVKPVEYSPRMLPMPSWLVGVLLGDGCLRDDSQVRLTTADKPIRQRVAKEIAPYGLALRHLSRYDYRIVASHDRSLPNPLLRVLRQLGLMGLYSYEKRIPETYLLASPDERLELLQGLMDTDGTVTGASRHEAARFTTSSLALADGVAALVQSLGGTVSRYLEKTSHRDSYRLTLSLPRGTVPFWLPRKRDRYPNLRPKYQPTRKIERIEYSRAAPAQCIKVEGELFVTNDYVVTHNTIQALGVINARDRILGRVLIICPNSVMGNWRREAWKWLTRLRDIQIANQRWPFMSDMVIVPYSKCAKFAEPMQETEWGLVVLDEAHLIKTPGAQRTKAVMGIKKAHLRLALTGTPILNRVEELKTVLKWLDSRWTAQALKPYVRQWRPLTELQEKLRESVMVRRLKKDVLTDLPAKRRQIVALDDAKAGELVERERETWEAKEQTMLDARVRVELSKASDDPADYENAIADMRRLVRVAFEEIAKMRVAIAEFKLPHVVTHVAESLESEHKIVVMAAHHLMVDGLREGLAKFNPVVLDGRVSTNPKVRQELVDRFMKDDECRVFIGTIKAAGVGLTLTAASTCVFGELDWVPANLSQAEDRVHRIGQNDAVLVQHIVLAGSLDERMAEVVIEKQKVADAGLDDPIAQNTPALTFGEPATWSSSRKDLGELAPSITRDEAGTVHQALRILASMCDGAADLDTMGFNKVDTRIGHALAEAASLTPRQAILGLRIAMRYRKRQLPAELRVRLEAIKPKRPKKAEEEAA